MGRRDNVVLLGDARMAFAVSEALHRHGCAVHAGVSRWSTYLEWSRYVTSSRRHAPLEPGDDAAVPAILDWIDEFHDRGGVAAIQPMNDAAGRMINRHRDAFRQRSPLVTPSPDVVALCGDKARMFDECEALGVPLAPYVRVTSREDAAAAVRAVGYPAILKPASVDAYLGGRKALIVDGPEAFERLFPAWPEEHPDLLVQRYVTGPRRNVMFSALNGRLLGAVEVLARRTNMADGTGYTTAAVTTEPTPSVRRSVEALVARLRYSTTGCAQFVVDPDTGETTFMELNPRVSLARIAERAGLPHSVWGYQIASGRTPEAPRDPWSFRRGVRYVWTHGDVQRLKRRVLHGERFDTPLIVDAARTAVDALTSHHAIFTPTDVAPAMGVYLNPLIARLAPSQRHRLS